MNNTRIEYCNKTWNPITGCYHGCPYCYASRIAARFGGYDGCTIAGEKPLEREEALEKAEIAEIGWSLDFKSGQSIAFQKGGKPAPFPFKFKPTFNHDKLDEPSKAKKPQTIFVCSMADMFGDWVPDEWIQAVFAACKAAPQHRYLFLTKNPARYNQLILSGILPLKTNFWYGFSAENHLMARAGIERMLWKYGYSVNLHKGEEDFALNTFVSFEPLRSGINMHGAFNKLVTYPQWIIMGAMTGPGSKEGRKYLHKSDVLDIAKWADENQTPVFMKDSLIPVVGEANMRRELPWK